jgi:PAS domain-containing protein
MTSSKPQDLSSQEVQERLKSLTPYLLEYAMGDFSRKLPVPQQEDEFTELLVSINLMVEDFQELMREQEDVIARLLETEAQLGREQDILSSMLNAIDDVIYVSDPDSFELLHVNQAFRDYWGEDALGTICHRTIQNREEPCPFCTNEIIFGEYLGRTYTWEFQNEVSGEWYRCSDKAIPWNDGRMVRFEIAANITAEKNTLLELERNLSQLERFNTLAVDREKRMIGLKREINRLSAELGRDEPYNLAFTEEVEVS